MVEKRKLDLTTVLNVLDTGDKNYYSNLSDEDKKLYTPLVLMRYMSSLPNQSEYKEYCLMAVNDLVNIGFWTLSKNHTELQHLLLCITGTKKRKQYRQWIPNKRAASKSKSIDDFLIEMNPGINQDELEILKSGYDEKSFKQLLLDSGISDQRVKSLHDDFKKHIKS